jgi:hypothetical protein
MPSPPATFRGLVLVALELDARPGLSLGRAQRRMSEPELAEIVRVVYTIPSSVTAWSEGNAAFDEFDVRIIDEPIRRLSRSGPDAFWVGPDAVAELLQRLAPRGRWDSVFVIHPSDGSYARCGWGCTIGPTRDAGGAGFSSIVSDRWQPDRDRLFPVEGFVHEWLHQVEAMYRQSGLPVRELPDLHDVADRTSARDVGFAPFGRGYVEYERETGTWQPWYRDLMTGTIGLKGDERAPVGLTADRWARRRPNA